MSEIKLTNQQRNATERYEGPLLVSAAAGSGKTMVLVERLFRAITEKGIDIDRFLIITYTKAAAAELRNKIAKELTRRLAAAPNDRHLRRQVLLVYQAQIKTIDAFCTSLLRENTHLLAADGDRHALTPDFRVLDEQDASLLRDRVMERTLEAFYENLGDDGKLLADTLGSGRDDSALRSLVLDLYAKLQSHAAPDEWLLRQQDAWREDAFEHPEDMPYFRLLLISARALARFTADQLTRAAGEMVGTDFEEKFGKHFTETAQGFTVLAEAENWEDARAARDAIPFPTLTKPNGRDKDDPEILYYKRFWNAAKDAARKRIQAYLNISTEEAAADLRAEAPAMRALMQLCADFSEAYRAEKLRLNCADFSDQEHLALRLLVTKGGTPTRLGQQIAARYEEILIDEYQDTNDVQNAIFHAVSRAGKNVFCVGDVKQSIYRFRLADPTIFLRKYQEYKTPEQAQGDEPRKILLSHNFRSRNEILDATNFIFRNILSAEMGDMEYGEEEKLRFGATYYPPREDCETEFHLICAHRKSPQYPDPVKKVEAEARYVAGTIRKMLDEGYPVTQGNDFRPCRPEDFAILMRSPGKRLAIYARALAERNIPVSFSENEGYFETVEITVALALLDVIDNPRQDVPLICVLRSPIFGFTPDRLAEIRANDRDVSFYDALTADKGADSVRFTETLRALREAARDMSVCRLLWHAYNTLGVLGVFGAMDDGATRRENLIALTRHAEKFEQNGYQGLFAFLRHLHALLDAKREIAAAGGAECAGVQMMTIHRSKGLEFPIVILCDLDKAFSDKDLKPNVLVHPELGLGPKFVDLKRKIRYPTIANTALHEAIKRENLSEEARVLYVGMTRAQEKLILIASHYGAEKYLKDLATKAACPVDPEAVASYNCYCDWLLLPLLCKTEGGALCEFAEAERPTPDESDALPWRVFLCDAETLRETPVAALPAQGEEAAEAETPFDASLLSWNYPYVAETRLPAKTTATQLKGRLLDAQIEENAQVREREVRPLQKPLFLTGERALTAAERGTATHLVLQHLDFQNPDADAQIDALKARGFLTEEQAKAVDRKAIKAFLASEIARELRASPRVEREYPFTLLVPANRYFPEAQSDDELLLQGVVDCWWETEDGVAVLDFKTDRVSGEEEVFRRAEGYYEQIRAYSLALSRVLGKSVVRRVLYFLHDGRAVEVAEN